MKARVISRDATSVTVEVTTRLHIALPEPGEAPSGGAYVFADDEGVDRVAADLPHGDHAQDPMLIVDVAAGGVLAPYDEHSGWQWSDDDGGCRAAITALCDAVNTALGDNVLAFGRAKS